MYTITSKSIRSFIVVAGFVLSPALCADNPNHAIAKIDSKGVNAVLNITQLANDTLQFQWVISSFPSASGGAEATKYPWHVHEKPVDASGNCTSTGGHWDPKHANTDASTYKCDPTQLDKCEAGDLSGKYGTLDGQNKTVLDASMTLKGSDSIIGKSVVIHYANSTRFVCANITSVNVSGSGNGSGNGQGSNAFTSNPMSIMVSTFAISLALVALF